MRDTIKKIGAQVVHRSLDAWDEVTGQREALIPPRMLARQFFAIRSLGFQKAYPIVGQHFQQMFVDLADIKPHHKVLEVGSGVGRMAYALKDFLDPDLGGEYMGIDIQRDGVKWCQENFSPRIKHFHFKHIDVYNELYNPQGSQLSSNVTFDFADATFDFVYLTSVFTHMLPDDIQRYCSEIARVMKPDASALMTFFILNQEAQEYISKGGATFEFRHQFDGYYSEYSTIVERAIAYEEESVNTFLASNQLTMKVPIQYGSWSGRKNGLSFQDIIVVTK